jgi:hypothetical protein
VTDPNVTDLRRELAKAREALAAAETHLARNAEMNAALHCATDVFYSPLHAKVSAALHGVDHALERTEPSPPVPTLDHTTPLGELAAVLADLDRCPHGRHEGDACSDGDSCNGTSAGNPSMPTGVVIGYDRYGDPIVMPSRENKHDPRAWRTRSWEQR